MERRPHVTISLSSYNEGTFVARTVAALLENTAYPSFDIVVHDDGSTDGSCDALPDDERVAVIRSPARHGVAGGKKIAIEACRGPLLLNMDCHVAPADGGWLDTLVQALRALDYRAVLSPVSVPLDAATWRLKHERPRVLTRLRAIFNVAWWREVRDREPWIEVSALRGIAKLMTREAYAALGGFDEVLTYGGEEADVSVRAWMAGFTCAYVPGSLIGHVFKGKSQFPRSYREEAVSRLRVAYKCLSDEGYARVVEHNQNYLEDAGGWGANVFTAAAATVQERLTEFIRAREEVRSRSVRTAEWLLGKFGIEL